MLVAESTRRVLGEHFVLADLGEHALKGVGTPMRVWRVESEVLATTRYAAMRAGSNAPLIGRPQELERILHAWRLTCEEGGRIVFVTGEAGMGKSRLVIAALEAPDLRPAATVCLQCSPYHAQSAFFPLRTWLRVALEDADDPEARIGAEALPVELVLEYHGPGRSTLGLHPDLFARIESERWSAR